VKWVKEGAQGSEFPFWDRVMLVFGDAERDRVIAKYELNPRQVFTWDNWKNTAGIAMSVEVAIDDADLILKYLVRGHTIRIIAMTKATHDEAETTLS